MPYVCPICGEVMQKDKAFSDAWVLKEHIKEHTLKEVLRAVGEDMPIYKALVKLIGSAEWRDK